LEVNERALDFDVENFVGSLEDKIRSA